MTSKHSLAEAASAVVRRHLAARHLLDHGERWGLPLKGGEETRHVLPLAFDLDDTPRLSFDACPLRWKRAASA